MISENVGEMKENIEVKSDKISKETVEEQKDELKENFVNTNEEKTKESVEEKKESFEKIGEKVLEKEHISIGINFFYSSLK